MPRDLDAPYVFVDPGVFASGVAWFSGRELSQAAYTARPLDVYSPVLVSGRRWLCICERPRVRSEYEQKRDRRRVRSKDIEDLLIAAGRMTGNLPTEYVSVASWKGTAQKGPMHDRMWRILLESEAQILARGLDGVAQSLHHNVYDAVCMGLKYLGRWR